MYSIFSSFCDGYGENQCQGAGSDSADGRRDKDECYSSELIFNILYHSLHYPVPQVIAGFIDSCC